MVEIHGELEPFSPGEEEVVQAELDRQEDIGYDELKRRMWKDKMLMQKLKEKGKHLDVDQSPLSSPSAKEELSRRKKMTRAQDSILKYMGKIMEVCKAQGFVNGIIPEKGKPVTGSSDSLLEWWKDKVRFDQSAPNAIVEFLPSVVADDSAIWSKVVNQEELLLSQLTKKYFKITDDHDGEIMNISSRGGEKRKLDFDSSEQTVPSTLLYACQNSLCSQSETGLGFVDKSSRKEHEMSRPCAYRSEETGASSTSTSTRVYGPDRSSSVDGNAQVLSVADWLDMEREEGSLNSEAHNFDFVTSLGDFGSYWDELISIDNNLAGPGEEFGPNEEHEFK